ncbi:MAG: tryptophan synthase subunit alpha [Actinomycetes bacterium]
MTETTRGPVEGSSAGVAAVDAAFATARDEGRAALVVYLPAGFPDMPTSRACLEAAAEAGADVLEVGFPFSDPIMDGPTIQAASQQALDLGYRVDDDLAMCAELTANVDAPALLMTYVTIPDTRGYDRFAEQARAAGLSGAILPDLPAGEAGPWLDAARPRDLATVFLASSVSADARLDAIAAASTGWVYAVGLLGVTGVKDVSQDSSRELVARIRERTSTPIAVGIGVKTGTHAAEVASYADGVIVGSSVVQAAGAGDPADAPDRVATLVRELRAGVERAAG